MKTPAPQIQNRDDALRALRAGFLSLQEVVALSFTPEGRDLRPLKIQTVLRAVKGVDAKKIAEKLRRFGISNLIQFSLKDLTRRQKLATLVDALNTKNRRAPSEEWPFIPLKVAQPKAKSGSGK